MLQQNSNFEVDANSLLTQPYETHRLWCRNEEIFTFKSNRKLFFNS